MRRRDRKRRLPFPLSVLFYRRPANTIPLEQPWARISPDLRQAEQDEQKRKDG